MLTSSIVILRAAAVANKTNFVTVRFRDFPNSFCNCSLFCYDHIVSSCTLAREASTVDYGRNDVKSSKVTEYS